jgi:hypothetical protein
MRGLISGLLVSVFVLGATVLAGCSSTPLPLTPEPEPPGPIVLVKDTPPDATPHVVRRLVAEAREQLDKDRAMVGELHDPRGRARAQNEADELDRELSVLASRVDNADSDNLDDVMNRLQLLDTRIDLFHEKLRAATERSTAVLKD